MLVFSHTDIGAVINDHRVSEAFLFQFGVESGKLFVFWFILIKISMLFIMVCVHPLFVALSQFWMDKPTVLNHVIRFLALSAEFPLFMLVLNRLSSVFNERISKLSSGFVFSALFTPLFSSRSLESNTFVSRGIVVTWEALAAAFIPV